MNLLTPSRIRSYVRWRGKQLREKLYKAEHKILYHHTLKDIPSHGLPESIIIRPVAPLEVGLLSRPIDEEWFRRLIENGHVLLGVWNDNQVIGGCWISGGKVFVSDLGRTIDFGDDRYLWYLWIDPDWRQRGLGSAVVTEGLETHTVDASMLFAITGWANGPSKALFESTGFQREHASYYKIGPLDWHVFHDEVQGPFADRLKEDGTRERDWGLE